MWAPESSMPGSLLRARASIESGSPVASVRKLSGVGGADVDEPVAFWKSAYSLSQSLRWLARLGAVAAVGDGLVLSRDGSLPDVLCDDAKSPGATVADLRVSLANGL